MDVTDKVFKFPDGKGGNYFKIQGKDGQWYDCDEQGRRLESGDEENAPVSATRVREKVRAERAQATVNMCVCIPQEIADVIEDYLGWMHRKNKKSSSRSALFTKALSAYIKKDTEYQKQRKEL